MSKTLFGLLVAVSILGATAARADWKYGPGPGARPPPPPASRFGHYEPRSFQVWVPGQPQQVWEPGRCFGRVGRFGPPRCMPGAYHTVVSPGHYETRTQWVWVAHHRQPQFGVHFTSPSGRVAVAIGPGY